MTKEQREDLLKAIREDINTPKSPEEARCNLISMGLLDENGDPSPNYYSTEEIEASKIKKDAKMIDDTLNHIGTIKQITTIDCDDEPDWDSPHSSVWVLAVDISGNVSVLEPPSIHDSFFDNGPDAESIGLPYENIELPMGVYKVICDFTESRDWETGCIDEWYFEPRSWEPLWQKLNIPEMGEIDGK
jgi:hypothetical protein